LLQVIENAEKLEVIPQSVSIGGLSAGGQMTAVMAHFARDEGIELKLQLMTVAATDFRQFPTTGSDIDPSCPYESFITYKDVPWGPLARVQWFLDQWLGTDEGK
jgi:acetyl esterase/lipase